MNILHKLLLTVFLFICSLNSYGDIEGCAINGDTEFYANDLGYVYYAPYSQSVRSFNGTPTSMSNWMDTSSLPCGTYYYEHTNPDTRPNCIAYKNDGSVASLGGSVTTIKQKCATENLPLDNSVYYLLAISGSCGWFLIKKNIVV